ncbi:MAG: hypothetical protein HKL86_10305 [Acidimicrobiaceae bacterium]|nr:hypothetical protein [Acidimicrobiaceae bacterium]
MRSSRCVAPSSTSSSLRRVLERRRSRTQNASSRSTQSRIACSSCGPSSKSSAIKRFTLRHYVVSM